MSVITPKQAETTCYLSEYARGLLKKALVSGAQHATLPLGLRHSDNYIISMTEGQIKTMEDASKVEGRATVKVSFRLEQLKNARRITRCELQAVVSPPTVDVDAMSFSELAVLYDKVTQAIAKRMAEHKAQASAMLQTCHVSYNEDLYCQQCKCKTENGEAEIKEDKGLHSVHAPCVVCQAPKKRLINTNKEIQEGIISFL